jgi:hypothetical protein
LLSLVSIIHENRCPVKPCGGDFLSEKIFDIFSTGKF